MSDLAPNAAPLNTTLKAEAAADMRMVELSVQVNEFLATVVRPNEKYFVELSVPIVGSTRTAIVFFSNGDEQVVRKMLTGALEDLAKPPPAARPEAN